MALHAALTRHIRESPRGPKVAAFFDLDRTLLAGFSASAFFRERLVQGRMTPREMADTVLAHATTGHVLDVGSASPKRTPPDPLQNPFEVAPQLF